MSILPGIKRCPCCEAVNIIITNKVDYDNHFKNLKNWKLKKRFNCRKCKEELGLFINNAEKNEEKLLWLNNLNIEEHYYSKLDLLEKRKVRLAKTRNTTYFETLKDIQDIENQIRDDKVKLKIKLKIQKKGIVS